MRWRVTGSSPSFEAAVRVLRRTYESEDVHINEITGRVSCNGVIVKNLRVKEHRNRVNVEEKHDS
jgi:hypothetical protein